MLSLLPIAGLDNKLSLMLLCSKIILNQTNCQKYTISRQYRITLVFHIGAPIANRQGIVFEVITVYNYNRISVFPLKTRANTRNWKIQKICNESQ